MDYLWCECMTTILSLLVCCSMYSYCNEKLNVDHFLVTKKCFLSMTSTLPGMYKLHVIMVNRMKLLISSPQILAKQLQMLWAVYKEDCVSHATRVVAFNCQVVFN